MATVVSSSTGVSTHNSAHSYQDAVDASVTAEEFKDILRMLKYMEDVPRDILHSASVEVESEDGNPIAEVWWDSEHEVWRVRMILP